MMWPEHKEFRELIATRTHTTNGEILFDIPVAAPPKYLILTLDVRYIPTADTRLGMRLEHLSGNGDIKATTDFGFYLHYGSAQWIVRPKAALFKLRWMLAGDRPEAQFGALLETVDEIPGATILWASSLGIDLTNEAEIGDAVCLPVIEDPPPDNDD